ncbi:MAG TPA: hypothetical protein VK666_27320 [Chryseolinea sp.]|nr:hypothetical protein [Chryseolinea sp.]
MIRFTAFLAGTSFFIAVLTILAEHLQWIHGVPSFFYQTNIFLSFTTFVIFAYLFRAARPDFFVQLYLLSMAVKLLAYGTYAGIMITEDRLGAAKNVVFFLILYVVFTALEIVFLYRKISH